MRPLDLRIKYKRDTGLPPTNGVARDFERESNYIGNITRDYAIWLEEKAWFLENARYSYKNETGMPPTFFDNKLSAINFNREYKEWLEEQICEGSIYWQSLISNNI